MYIYTYTRLVTVQNMFAVKISRGFSKKHMK